MKPKTKTVKVSLATYKLAVALRTTLRKHGLGSLTPELRRLAGDPQTISIGTCVALATAFLQHFWQETSLTKGTSK